MDKQIKMDVSSDIKIQLDGINVLRENLGVAKTLKFLEQFDCGGSGDYTKEKYEKDDIKLNASEIVAMFNNTQ